MTTQIISVQNGSLSGAWTVNQTSGYITNAGTDVSLIYSGTVKSEDNTENQEVIKSKKKVRGAKTTTSGKYTSQFRLSDINPKIYFKYVKSKLSKIEVDILKKRLSKIRPLLLQAEEMKQQALFEALSLQLAILVREQEAFAIGHDKRLHRSHIEKFIKKVEGKCIKFEPLEKFPRTIPVKVRDKIKKVRDCQVFDDFTILYIDHTGEELKTNKQKIKEKDPILFGSFKFQPDVFYFIVDWIDKYCDLTLTKLIDELQVDDPEFELDSLPELDEKYIKAIMQDVSDRASRLDSTKPSNFRQLMEEEDRVNTKVKVEEEKPKKKTVKEKVGEIVKYRFGKNQKL